jgi:hypothetical protein
MYVLVDYDSVRKTFCPREPSPADHRDTLHYTVSNVLESTITASPVREMAFRLYGGWLDEIGEDTEDLTLVSRAVRNHPRMMHRIRVLIEPALSLLAHREYNINGTLREREIPRFRIRQDLDNCPLQPNCSANQLQHWLRGRCPSIPQCTRRLSDTLTANQQKLVDGMILADMFTVCSDLDQHCILVSNDDDMIPAVVTVYKLFGARHFIKLLRLGRRQASPYDEELSRLGILEDI